MSADEDWGSPEVAVTDFDISIITDGIDTSPKPFTFRRAMEEIKGPKFAAKIKAIRNRFTEAGGGEGGKKKVSRLKLALPGYLFCGTFDHRNANNLKQKSGIICADLDLLGDELGGIKEQLCADPHILAVFISPTGTGLKVVLRIDPAKDFDDSFNATEQFFLERFGLEIDSACSDVVRICYASHDPEAFVADDAEIIPYPAKPVEYKPTQYLNGSSPVIGELHPGDDYDQRGDMASLLMAHGWTKVGSHGWRRPDKTDGISATWDKVPGRFYVFSSSTGFEPNHTYKPWHVYAKLKCGGDFKQAARELGNAGFGKAIKPRAQLPQIGRRDSAA